ncbi:MAG: ABC transporter ATP-binding protein, partial [Clostridia bacterium]|nr:ABC transporter ATP-binding protein [Clostridia bacterium]
MAKKQKAPKGTLRKVLKYISGYTPLLIISLLFAAVSVILTLRIPLLCGEAIDLIVDKNNVALDGIVGLLTEVVICIVCAALAQWLMNIINNKITYQVVRDIRKDAFDKIQILPLSYIDSHRTGETVSRVISDVDQFAEGLLMGFTQLFTG